MDSERFNLLVNVLKIIEKQKSPTNMENLIEIIENYNEDLTQDQKALVLREILNFTRKEEARTQHFIEAERSQTARTVSKPDYLF